MNIKFTPVENTKRGFLVIPVGLILIFMYLADTPAWFHATMGILMWITYIIILPSLVIYHINIDFRQIPVPPKNFWRSYAYRIVLGTIFCWIIYDVFGLVMTIAHLSVLFLSLAFTWRWRNTKRNMVDMTK